MSDYVLSHKTPTQYAVRMVAAWLTAITIASAFVWLIMLNIWVAVCALVLDGNLVADVVELWLNIRIEVLSAAYFGFWVGILTSAPIYIMAVRVFTTSAAKRDREGQS